MTRTHCFIEPKLCSSPGSQHIWCHYPKEFPQYSPRITFDIKSSIVDITPNFILQCVSDPNGYNDLNDFRECYLPGFNLKSSNSVWIMGIHRHANSNSDSNLLILNHKWQCVITHKAHVIWNTTRDASVTCDEYDRCGEFHHEVTTVRWTCGKCLRPLIGGRVAKTQHASLNMASEFRGTPTSGESTSLPASHWLRVGVWRGRDPGSGSSIMSTPRLNVRANGPGNGFKASRLKREFGFSKEMCWLPSSSDFRYLSSDVCNRI